MNDLSSRIKNDLACVPNVYGRRHDQDTPWAHEPVGPEGLFKCETRPGGAGAAFGAHGRGCARAGPGAGAPTARQKAARGATQVAMDMAGNGGSLAPARRAIAPAARDHRTATRHNRKCGPGTILVLIAPARRHPKGDRRGPPHGRHTPARAHGPGAAGARQAWPRIDEEGKAHDGAVRGQRDADHCGRGALAAQLYAGLPREPAVNALGGTAGLAMLAVACAMLAVQPPGAGAEIPNVSISAPADMTFVSTGLIIALGMDSYGIATVEAVTDTDLAMANDAPAAFTTGTTTITWTITDAAGRAEADTQEVTVFPGCVSPRHPTHVEARGPRTAIVPGDSNALPDGVSDTSLSVTTNARPFKVEEGRTILWTMADDGGNTATCTERIIVRDRTPPSFPETLPDILVASAVPVSVSSVTLVPPEVTDIAGSEHQVYHEETGTFSVGENTVTWIATDFWTNTSFADQKVIVRKAPEDAGDAEPPECTSSRVPKYIEARGEHTAIVPADGNILPDGAPGGLVLSHSHPPIEVDDWGFIRWTVTNSAGLSASCTQAVIVHDTTPPSFTGALPDIVVESAVPVSVWSVGLEKPKATDIADPDPAVYHEEEGKFGMGENEVTWFARDASINESAAVQKVIVRPPVAP